MYFRIAAEKVRQKAKYLGGMAKDHLPTDLLHLPPSYYYPPPTSLPPALLPPSHSHFSSSWRRVLDHTNLGTSPTSLTARPSLAFPVLGTTYRVFSRVDDKTVPTLLSFLGCSRF